MFNAKLLLQLYFTWKVNSKNEILGSAILYAFIGAMYSFFLLYLGNIAFVFVLLIIAVDFISMFVYLWILEKHSGVTYFIIVALSIFFFQRSSSFLMGKFVSF